MQFNRWQYTEVGEFLDYDTGEIFRDSFTDDGVETGPVFLAGLRFPVGASLLLGGEWRYATAKADLDPDRRVLRDKPGPRRPLLAVHGAYKFK